eukprot:UN26995
MVICIPKNDNYSYFKTSGGKTFVVSFHNKTEQSKALETMKYNSNLKKEIIEYLKKNLRQWIILAILKNRIIFIKLSESI